jgi:hypothetical protein
MHRALIVVTLAPYFVLATWLIYKSAPWCAAFFTGVLLSGNPI